MQMFLTDSRPQICAEDLCDAHTNKMRQEAAQIAATAIQVGNMVAHDPDKLVAPTHVHHPLVKWAMKDMANLSFVIDLGLAIHAEHTRRYQRETAVLYAECLRYMRSIVPNQDPPETFMFCAKDKTYEGDIYSVSHDYRKYIKEEKLNFAMWTNRKPPAWLDSSMYALRKDGKYSCKPADLVEVPFVVPFQRNSTFVAA